MFRNRCEEACSGESLSVSNMRTCRDDKGKGTSEISDLPTTGNSGNHQRGSSLILLRRNDSVSIFTCRYQSLAELGGLYTGSRFYSLGPGYYRGNGRLSPIVLRVGLLRGSTGTVTLAIPKALSLRPPRGRFNRNIVSESQKFYLADSAHMHKVSNPLEGTLFLTELQNPLHCRRTMPGRLSSSEEVATLRFTFCVCSARTLGIDTVRMSIPTKALGSTFSFLFSFTPFCEILFA